jgi:hypothetical protein
LRDKKTTGQKPLNGQLRKFEKSERRSKNPAQIWMESGKSRTEETREV